ncbi:MAG TPA: NAD(P)/FAD-dependent oxidoreductase, partial [Thermoleophilaceae bacterium]|nr:NAD(P)/FAD-dependent oxidoreductase [Thermoleophilaceae bacterium]
MSHDPQAASNGGRAGAAGDGRNSRGGADAASRAHGLPAAAVPEVRVAIVGSGFAGLGMAIRLKQEGVEDFVVLERADDVGGTWRDNSYPGATCDVPSHLYSFSFDPNPAWSRSFSPQPEIWDYLRGTAERHGVTPHLRLGHEVLAATWDEDRRRWAIETSRGSFTAQVLVSGVGALSEPATPRLPGLESFRGRVFHSATWDHSHDLTGERVAVIGTGASAIQFVPQIQPLVRRLALFQRTPPWVVPRTDRAFTALEKRLFRSLPAVQRLVRAAIYWSRESYVVGFTTNPKAMKAVELLARLHLRRQVKGPGLREKLRPAYTIGCKRILISNDYYPALGEPNVEVVTDAIGEVRPGSIVSVDGTEREIDTIIFGTGFQVTEPAAATWIRGRGGRRLADAWRDGMTAYLGTAIAGFPNLFFLTGPNTGLGHTSMIYMIEAQVEYVLDALRTMDRRALGAVDVRPEVQADFNTELQRSMEGTVWTSGGCASWYLDASGRNTTLWPDFTFRFRRRTSSFA